MLFRQVSLENTPFLQGYHYLSRGDFGVHARPQEEGHAFVC
jgi:hypothetical protein